MPARLHWPADAGSGQKARVPLVVFSHGMGGSRRGYSYLARAFAARGVASLHVQHVGSDRSVWAGNPFALVQRLQTAAQESEALARGQDCGSRWIACCRTRPVRMARGSIGGASWSRAIRMAPIPRWLRSAPGEARRPPAGSEGPALFGGDPDFVAAVLRREAAAPVLENVSVPTLHMTATDDVIQIPGYYSPASDRLAIYNAIATPRKAIAVFQGGCTVCSQIAR